MYKSRQYFAELKQQGNVNMAQLVVATNQWYVPELCFIEVCCQFIGKESAKITRLIQVRSGSL